MSCYSHRNKQICPIFLCSNFSSFWTAHVSHRRVFSPCVSYCLVPGCVLYFPIIGQIITHALNGAQIRHIWMCLFEFALAKRVADSEHYCVRSLRSLASLENIESMSLSSPVSTARAAALQPPWTRRSTAAADEDVLLEFAWASPRRAWSTGRARASFSLRGPSHPCQMPAQPTSADLGALPEDMAPNFG